MKKTLLVLIVAVLMAGMVFAGGAKEDDGVIKVGFITQALANPSQAYAWKTVQANAPDFGYEVTVFDEEYDPQNGVAAITTCIAQGYDAIMINPTDASALIPSMMEARDAGIIVSMYSSEVPAEYTSARDFMCGSNDYLAGEIAAETLMAAFPNGVNVVEIGGQSGHNAQIQRTDGFMDKIAGSKVNVLDSRDCEAWATDDALAIMEDFIIKYGDDIQAAYCHWDNGATGIIQALQAAGMDDVYVIGVDGNSVGYDQVIAGTQALSVGQSFNQMTLDSFANIKKVMNGESVPSNTWTALDVVTADTVNNFPYPEW